MAKEHFFDSHSIRVRRRGSKANQFEPQLGNVGEDGFDSLLVVSSFLDSMAPQQSDEETGQLVLKESIHVFDEKQEIIYGFLGSGQFGSPFETVDKTDPTKREKHGKEIAQVRSFFFLIQLPKKADTGALILHKIGPHGIQGHFVPDMVRFFAETVPDCLLEIGPVHYNLTPDHGANLTDIKVTLFKKKTKDSIAASGNSGPVRRSRKALGIVVPIYLKGAALLKQMMKPGNDAQEIAINQLNPFVEINLAGFDTEVKAVVKIGKRKRVVKISRKFSYSTLRQVTEELKFDPDGHATLESLVRQAMIQIDTLSENGALS